MHCAALIYLINNNFLGRLNVYSTYHMERKYVEAAHNIRKDDVDDLYSLAVPL